jgi:iron complex transport system substrate-binding protein
VNVNHLNQPAPRIVEPLTQMAQAFHSEAYAAANETTTTTDAPDDGGDDGSTNGSVPGFGAVTALVAFVGAALLARR